MRVLVTGGGGQLATALARSAPADVDVVMRDLASLDITDRAAVERCVAAERPQAIINAAAYTAVDKAEGERDLAFAVNAAGAEHLASAAQRTGARLLHVSTDFVFDGRASRPYAPDAAPNPLSVYGWSKLEGEQRVLAANADAVVVRTSWLYSPYGGNFAKTMLRLLAQRDVEVVSDQIGTPTSAAVLAVMLWRLVARPDIRGVVHGAGAGVASWYDFAVAIAEEARRWPSLGIRGRVRPIVTEQYPTPAIRPPYSVLDSRALWSAVDIDPQHWRVDLRAVLEELAHA